MKRKGILIRVGIDQTFGNYNAPMNPETNDYIYMPIPQSSRTFRSGMLTSYMDIKEPFLSWCNKNGVKIEFPEHLENWNCHLDPDFKYSTYGDQATGRGLRIGALEKGDFLVFFASFKPISPCDYKLVYALYGIMFVKEVLKISQMQATSYHMNAHTRVVDMNREDWVVFANPSSSGRFNKVIPVGEFRNKSYRVKESILDMWGGIGVKDGFIQRSVNPPWFNEPDRFLKWLDSQNVELINNNW